MGHSRGVSLFDPHLAAITDSQPHHVFAPERALAPHTTAPTDLPDHARRVAVHVQNSFAPGASVPCPRLRLAETRAVLRCGAVVGATTPARLVSRVLLPRLCWLSGCIFTPPRSKPLGFIARHTAADRCCGNGNRSTTCLDATLQSRPAAAVRQCCPACPRQCRSASFPQMRLSCRMQPQRGCEV
jgi:hypothetical protein